MISYEPLENIMKEKSISQLKLAEMSGISVSMIRNILKGRNNTSVEVIDKLCSVLECNIADIVCYKPYIEKNIYLSIDWSYLVECLAETEWSLRNLSIAYGKSASHLFSKKSNNGKLEAEELKFIAEKIGHAPEEFIID